mgnify:CR=1 FL=1
MGELNSKFSREDIETLLESISDWECVENQEYQMMSYIKALQLPSEDNPAYNSILAVKENFKSREKEIKESRITRQERAVFLKAKLMLVRRDMGIDQLFEMATESAKDAESSKSKLDLAEEFIRDLGVWKHYQEFIAAK